VVQLGDYYGPQPRKLLQNVDDDMPLDLPVAAAAAV
jgi:hypothetical protein